MRSCSWTHAASASASSIASFVPDPIEKCAVCAASPSSTTLPCRQRSLRTVVKLIHRELFACTAWSCRMPAKRRRISAMLSSSLSPGANARSARALEPCPPPHVVVHLDDERAPGGVVRVSVNLHDPVRRVDDVELERVEDEVGAEPHEPAPANVEPWMERAREGRPRRGVHTVGADDEVMRRGELVHRRRLTVEVKRHPQLQASLVQDLQQPPPAHRGKAVTARRDHLVAVVDVDVVPARELPGHRPVDRGVGVLDAAERLVREHHTEPEGVVRGVALPHGDLVARVELHGERREVESARPAPDYRYAHLSLGATVKCRPS